VAPGHVAGTAFTVLRPCHTMARRLHASEGISLPGPRNKTSTSARNYAVGTVPPSMTYSVPVMEAARGEARKATRSGTSLGVDGRPIVIRGDQDTRGGRKAGPAHLGSADG
jgi:hypothetical protein